MTGLAEKVGRIPADPNVGYRKRNEKMQSWSEIASNMFEVLPL